MLTAIGCRKFYKIFRPWTTNCSIGNIFYIPILAETIQGPLEEMFKFSTYRFQPLPLRHLRDEKAWKGKFSLWNYSKHYQSKSIAGSELKCLYPFKEFATTITQTIARAIINIPVEKRMME
ncbi:12244_t:CDS:2, partial [Funneliformis caledonium]